MLLQLSIWLSSLTYNSSYWAYAEFPRFVIPAVPMVLIGYEPYLPKSRSLIWALAVISPILAALSAFGVKNAMHRFGL
jgi:hypothetical protein